MGNRETEYLKRFVTAKTAVFWDLQDCRIPDGLKAVEVSQNIRSALVEMNYHGTAVIYAYGDTNQFMDDLEQTACVHKHTPSGDSKLDREVMKYRGTISIYADNIQAGLKSPAIIINHTPEGDKDARLEMIIVDMFTWALKNPSPANCMLILGDITRYNEFTSVFHRLRAYNLLLAQPEKASAPPELPVDARFLWERWSYGHIDRVKRDRSPRPLPLPLPRDKTDPSRVGSGSGRSFLFAGVVALVGLVYGWMKLTSYLVSFPKE